MGPKSKHLESGDLFQHVLVVQINMAKLQITLCKRRSQLPTIEKHQTPQ
jgi:hypothetical protein